MLPEHPFRRMGSFLHREVTAPRAREGHPEAGAGDPRGRVGGVGVLEDEPVPTRQRSEQQG